MLILGLLIFRNFEENIQLHAGKKELKNYICNLGADDRVERFNMKKILYISAFNCNINQKHN